MAKRFNPLNGLIEEFAEDGLPGPKGDRGEIGPIGPIGPAGRDGLNGKNGIDGKEGKQGPKGKQGIQGPAGLDGKIGPKGDKGDQGKNAPDSTVIHKSIMKPNDSLGNDGDWCITVQTELYHKENGKWVFFQILAGRDGNTRKHPAYDVPFNDSASLNTVIGTDVQEVFNRLFEPSESEKPTFAADGTITTLEKFSSATQVTANRTTRIEMTYNSDLNPTQELVKIYDLDDGTTILKTITKTYTWTSGVLTKVETVTA